VAGPFNLDNYQRSRHTSSVAFLGHHVHVGYAYSQIVA